MLSNNNTYPQKFISSKMMMSGGLGTASISKLQGLKKGIWLYFFLLIFEGALRKWFLPGLAAPLLIVRDPIALWILVVANQKKMITLNNYLLTTVVLSIFGILTAVALGHGNLWVALFGARIFLIHFPLIFVIGKVFTQEDVLKMGRVLLIISIPMTVLVALQFYSPQSAWVNRGVGGDVGGAGFDGANGFFRPPATFSFITGTIGFYGMAASFIIYFWLVNKYINRIVLIAASICLLFTIPMSISRSLFFEVVISGLFGFMVMSRKPKFIVKAIPIIIFSIVALVILSTFSTFQTATEAFTMRFDTANENEGGLQSVFLDRFFGGLISALTDSGNLPFFGYGLGMGTNVGSMLLSGKVTFLIAEVEWGRIIGEMGPLLGLSIILVRVVWCVKTFSKSFKEMVSGNILPWMLLSFGLLNIAQGQWAQPTILGFSVLIGGLILASFNINSYTNTSFTNVSNKSQASVLPKAVA